MNGSQIENAIIEGIARSMAAKKRNWPKEREEAIQFVRRNEMRQVREIVEGIKVLLREELSKPPSFKVLVHEERNAQPLLNDDLLERMNARLKETGQSPATYISTLIENDLTPKRMPDFVR